MGERKRNAIDTNVSMAFLSFSLVLIRIHVTATIESVNSSESFQPATLFVAIKHNTSQIRARKKESLGLFWLKPWMFFEECFFFRSGSSSKHMIAMRIASESFNDFTVHEFVLLTTLKPWFVKPFYRPIMHG